MSRQFELGTELTDEDVAYLTARGRDEFIVENARVLEEQQGERQADAAAEQAAAEAEANAPKDEGDKPEAKAATKK